MFKRPITYHDLDGNELTENFMFGLNKAEITEINLGKGEAGLTAYVKAIITAGNTADLISIFKDLILKSYGVRGKDGKQFVKIDENTGRPLSIAFSQTEAYSNLFMELATDSKAATEFLMGIVPSDVAAEAKNVDVEAEAKKLMD